MVLQSVHHELDDVFMAQPHIVIDEHQVLASRSGHPYVARPPVRPHANGQYELEVLQRLPLDVVDEAADVPGAAPVQRRDDDRDGWSVRWTPDELDVITVGERCHINVSNAALWLEPSTVVS